MKSLLIHLLGGKTQEEYLDRIQNEKNDRERNYISIHKLDYASTLLKRWNEYRGSINTLAKDILKNNPDYFKSNSSLFFDLVLQDHYFRRLFLLQNKIDFFENSENNITNFRKAGYGTLSKVFWEIEPKFLELINSDKFIKDWNKF